jgi:hypothetical protein
LVVKNFSGQNRPGVVWLKWQGDLSQLFDGDRKGQNFFRQGSHPLYSCIPTVFIKRNGYYGHQQVFLYWCEQYKNERALPASTALLGRKEKPETKP